MGSLVSFYHMNCYLKYRTKNWIDKYFFAITSLRDPSKVMPTIGLDLMYNSLDDTLSSVF